MKIFFFSPYLSIPELKDFSKNNSGFGIACKDIAVSIGGLPDYDVDVLTQSNITDGMTFKTINLVKRTWSNLFYNINLIDFKYALKVILEDSLNFKESIRLIFYSISCGYARNLISQKKYDIIHVHGLGYYTYPFINMCNLMKIKYVITLHGLNFTSDSINVNGKEKQREKKFIKDSIINNLPISVVSSGVKKKIEQFFKKSNVKNINVIYNGISSKQGLKNNCKDVRYDLKIHKKSRVVLCIGNVSENKNQIQVVESLKYIDKELLKNTIFLFLGEDNRTNILKSKIKESNFKDNLIYCGSVPSNEMGYYYMAASLNVTASFSEGFGLPFIEAFSYGVPSVAFADLDSMDDLYSDDAIHKIYSRTTKDLGEGIETALNKNWEKDKIINHSKKFSILKCSLLYDKFYKNSLNDKKVY